MGTPNSGVYPAATEKPAHTLCALQEALLVLQTCTVWFLRPQPGRKAGPVLLQNLELMASSPRYSPVLHLQLLTTLVPGRAQAARSPAAPLLTAYSMTVWSFFCQSIKAGERAVGGPESGVLGEVL